MRARATFDDLPRSIVRPLSVSEVAAVAEVEQKRVHRMIDDQIIPKAMIVPSKLTRSERKRRLLKPEACPFVSFSASTGEYVSAKMRRRVFAELGRLLRGETASVSIEEGVLKVDVAKVMRDSLKRLHALATAEAAVVVDPDIRGGMPVLRGTRIGVYEIAGMAAVESDETILEAFPSLNRRALANAKLYALARPLIGRPSGERGRDGSAQVRRVVEVDPRAF
jgi:uncharacterized protein (DUF433 family)